MHGSACGIEPSWRTHAGMDLVCRVEPNRHTRACMDWRVGLGQIGICQNFQSLVSWEATFPSAGSTIVDARHDFITLYATIFKEGNFWLPVAKFVSEVLTSYGIHISQVSLVVMPRITHFEFIYRAHNLVPTFDRFNVFHYVSVNVGFYSFNSRTRNVLPCAKDPLRAYTTGSTIFLYSSGCDSD
ncbi:hypothetical protein Hanom_Chr00s007557g01738021 [Helianthus anomalus]